MTGHSLSDFVYGIDFCHMSRTLFYIWKGKYKQSELLFLKLRIQNSTFQNYSATQNSHCLGLFPNYCLLSHQEQQWSGIMGNSAPLLSLVFPEADSSAADFGDGGLSTLPEASKETNETLILPPIIIAFLNWSIKRLQLSSHTTSNNNKTIITIKWLYFPRALSTKFTSVEACKLLQLLLGY